MADDTEQMILSLQQNLTAVMQERDELRALINNPHIEEFFEAVKLEVPHQRVRWSAEHDAGKTDEEWFWLIGHLASKALISARLCEDGRLPLAFLEEHRKRTLHHIITTAATLANWHAARTGESNIMRPGIDPPKPKIPVSMEALSTVLFALVGPDHHIRELQVTRSLDDLVGGVDGVKPNPINVLLREYNTWVEEQNASASKLPSS